MLFATLTTILASFTWLFLFRVIDFFHREPWKALLTFFASGALAVLVPYYLPVIFDFGSGKGGIFLDALINVSLVEEGAKLLFFFLAFLIFRKELDDGPDWLVYGAAVGLGFGAVENVLYAWKYGDLVLHFREIITLSGHAFDTGILLFGVWSVKQKKLNEGILWIATGIFSHALYDALLIMGQDEPIYTPMAFGVYLVSIELYCLMINNALNHSRYFDSKIAMPARAVRAIMTSIFLFLGLLFLLTYIREYGADGIGVFLFYSAPLLVIIYVTVNRITSLVLVEKKSFPIIPIFPFQYIGMDLGPSSTMNRFVIRGIPYDELDFVSYIGETTEIRPVNRNFDYFGDTAEIEFTGKVYAKSQILFYPVRFVRSDDPIHDDRHFYVVPKFIGNKEQGNYVIAGLVSRDHEINNDSGDTVGGGFCCWILLRKKERPGIWKDFVHLMNI
ncbi:MAG: PrsW family intramembrane metalloprotease [Bacteroidetes bacterium]|nr:PrsW family intramembrane metalloprotease [Bacteroidota bacterium]